MVTWSERPDFDEWTREVTGALEDRAEPVYDGHEPFEELAVEAPWVARVVGAAFCIGVVALVIVQVVLLRR